MRNTLYQSTLLLDLRIINIYNLVQDIDKFRDKVCHGTNSGARTLLYYCPGSLAVGSSMFIPCKQHIYSLYFTTNERYTMLWKKIVIVGEHL
jgi:hypothetical protein